MKNKIIFYGLLYFSKKDINPNFRYSNYHSKYKVLINNAYNLASSLYKQDLKFILLTNSIRELKKFRKYNFPVKEINFKKKINNNTKFFTAHFKLDTFVYFEKQKHNSCLLDLDVIAINKIKKILTEVNLQKTSLVYDLNDKKNFKYNKKILKTLQWCNNLKDNEPNWYGGEFILGNEKFYKELNKNIKIVLPNYKKNLKRFHHVGDETIVNSALQLIKKKKSFLIRDISKMKIIKRYWSIPTKSKQDNLKTFLNNHFLLHLPADKIFLSNLDVDNITYKEIRKKYKNKVLSLTNIMLYRFKSLINFVRND